MEITKLQIEKELAETKEFQPLATEMILQLTRTLELSEQEYSVITSKQQRTKEALSLAEWERDQEKLAKEDLARRVQELKQKRTTGALGESGESKLGESSESKLGESSESKLGESSEPKLGESSEPKLGESKTISTSSPLQTSNSTGSAEPSKVEVDLKAQPQHEVKKTRAAKSNIGGDKDKK